MSKINNILKDFEGNGKNIIVPNSDKLTGYNGVVNISKYSGLVSVVNRRSSKEIADEWSNKIFSKKFENATYTSKVPAVTARLTYVVETIINEIKTNNKTLCDIGAGEGDFLKIFKNKKVLKKLIGVEPSKKNCIKMKKNKIKNFVGTAEEYAKSTNEKVDIVTLTWTLCNTSSCIDVIKSASKILKKNGYIVIAESSRILVPFKKPIQMYFGKKSNPDVHSFHFSKNSLRNLLIINGFRPIYINRYIDSDWLVIIGKKINKIEKEKIKTDKYLEVKKFFQDWYNHSKRFKKELIS